MKIKRGVFISLIFVTTVVFAGCTAKSNTPVGTGTAASVPDAVSSVQTAPTDSTASTASTSSSQTSTVDTSTLDKTFSDNYTEALTTANASLQNKATFCSSQVEYTPGTSSIAKIKYYFTADLAGIKDYYWVVEFDPFSSISKKRSLAAKKDLGDDIICVKTAAQTPASYTSAINTLVTSGATLPPADSIARIVLSLKDSAWNIVMWSKTGQALLSQMIPITASSSNAATSNSTTNTF